MPLSEAASARIEAAKKSLLNAQNPLMEGLPSWVDWMRVQSQAGVIREIVDAFSTVDVVVLDAPTGSGKSLVGEMVRRLMDVKSAIYCCSTIALQDQFAHDFEYSCVLKGRSNYATLKTSGVVLSGETLLNARYGDTLQGSWDISCADCTYTKDVVVADYDDDGNLIGERKTKPCDWCVDKAACPYELAKLAAVMSPLAVLNTRYLLTEGNGPGRLAGRGLVIADECDTLESELMGYVSVDISQRRAKTLGIQAPAKVSVQSSWGDWFVDAISKVEAAVDRLPPFSSASVKERRDRKALGNLAESLQVIQADTTGWVFTGDARKQEWGTVSFKPVRVDQLARKSLWPLGDKWLLMSATPISAHQMVRDDLGYEGEFRTVTMASSFPVENRPIVVQAVANMSRKTQLADRHMILTAFAQIYAKHPGENILIHTVSYQLAGWLADEIRDAVTTPVWTYSSSGEKLSVVAQFKANGGILIAPSLDRGVDLPDDLCSVIVVAKVPFPNLGDRQVSARMHSAGGQTWYNVQAVRSMVQMTGRGVRHKGDKATTYILDSQFDRIWNSARSLFPEWWTDALQWRR